MTASYISSSLRQRVYDRANGICEYCLIPEKVVLAAHEIDHIVALKHGGSSDFENLPLSCVLCNKHKGSDLTSIDPDTGQIVRLYHPCLDKWSEHFRLYEAQLIGITQSGRATVRLLQFNLPDRLEERQFLVAANMIQTPGGTGSV